MNIVKFQKLAKIIQLILLLVVSFYIFVAILSFGSLLFSPDNLLFEDSNQAFDVQLMTTISESAGTIPLKESGTLSLLPFILLYSYFIWLGSQLFADLGAGESPFTFKQVKRLKVIGLGLILTEIFHPLLLSLVTTLMMTQGYYLTLGFSLSTIFIGLLFFSLSQIFGYGITLQQLSDEII